MIIYKLWADNYKKLLETGKIDKETAEQNIKIFDFLSTCDTDDICALADTGAFNDIIRAYCRKSMTNLDLDEKTVTAVMSELNWLFDMVNAKNILK